MRRFRNTVGDQEHEGRRQEQDQALQPDRDVLQAEEIEVAGQVVADQAQADQAPAVAHDSGGWVRIFQIATAANTGSENSILKAIKVTASMW
jgi:hypothetical protein